MKGSLVPAILFSAAAWSQQIPVEGRPDSAVRILIFEDVQCSDCAAFRKMLDDKLLPKYGGKVAFAHRDFPLAKHAWARQAAIASRYFAGVRAELGLEFRRETMARIPEISQQGFEHYLEAFARGHDMNPADAAASLQDGHLQAAVEKDFQEGVARGVSKTPTVFVNGQPFIETFTVEEISAAIDRALAQNP